MKKISNFYCVTLVLALIICIGYSSTTASAEDKTTFQSITVPTINLYQEDTPEVDQYQITIPAGEKVAVQKLEISGKGKLFLPVTGKNLTKGVTLELYKDAACTDKLTGSAYLSATSPESILKSTILEGGTYYLKVFAFVELEAENTVSIQPYFYNGEDKTLTNKKETGTFAPSYDQPVYHKIVLKKSGFIKLEGMGLDQYNSTISAYVCDSKQKEIGNSYNLSTRNSNTEYIGLKKGTYYIRIKNSSPYSLKYTEYTVSDQGGKKQSKATAIKKNATKKGIVYATDASTVSDWFKITLTKQDNIKFDITTKASGTISFKLIAADDKQVILYNTIRVGGATTEKIVSQDKFSKGTYYIQVSNNNNLNTSGYYSIKAKN